MKCSAPACSSNHARIITLLLVFDSLVPYAAPLLLSSSESNIAASPLPELLRRTFALPENAQIVLGNGSDEIIQFIALLVAQ